MSKSPYKINWDNFVYTLKGWMCIKCMSTGVNTRYHSCKRIDKNGRM